jgi:hypothetical protein
MIILYAYLLCTFKTTTTKATTTNTTTANKLLISSNYCYQLKLLQPCLILDTISYRIRDVLGACILSYRI